jgi:(4S)-4-hydroxy-5-phosphonooxypentane-2,3-dione isomerase
MFTLIVQLDVLELRVDEFEAGIHANAASSLRDEPGCLRFDVHRSLDAPGRFHLYEIYTDRNAFEVGHRSAPHYAAWRQIVDRCVVPNSHINIFAAPAFPRDIPERPGQQ